MRRRVLEILARVRADLEQVEVELEQEKDLPDEDLVQVRARVDALESRVAAIEKGREG